MPEERRINRSDNIHEALHLQLAATAKSARFSSVVLAEEQGLKVASTGDTPLCEEIAAFSPQLASGSRIWQGKVKTEGGAARLVTIAPVQTDWGKLFLCAVGGSASAISGALLTGGIGVERILA